MSELEGFEVRRTGKKTFAIRCRQCGFDWQADAHWLALMLKHAKYHEAQHQIIVIKTRPHGTVND